MIKISIISLKINIQSKTPKLADQKTSYLNGYNLF
jgi:hypothetical protein